ncbi:MAG TPA: hypothetical protein VLV49_07310 [Terriglobales bacterium]|nr:hypothetical protein [Terriglobales bacterium]
MKDIHQVLRRKRAQMAQLAKEVQLLEDAERKLQEVSALLAEGDEEDENPVLGEVDEEASQPAGTAVSAPAMASASSSMAAASAGASSAESSARPRAPRWP